MHPEQRIKAESYRLKKMGVTLIILAIGFNLSAYFIAPEKSQEGIFPISALLGFLGFYCLGAVWRRKNFI